MAETVLQGMRDPRHLLPPEVVLRSPRFEVGPLARVHEAPITAFPWHVLEHLG